MLKLNELNTYILRLLRSNQTTKEVSDDLADLKKDLDTDSLMEPHSPVASDMNFDSSQDIGAALESFADHHPGETAQIPASEYPGFSRLNVIFTIALILSLIGFSTANWMLHKHLAQLSDITTDLQTKFQAMDANKNRDKKNMQNRIAGLEDSFRQVRLQLGQQSGDDKLIAIELRLVEAEKEISRLRLVMHSASMHKRTRYAKTPVKKSRIVRLNIKPKPTKTALQSRHKNMVKPAPISKNPQKNWFVNLATRSDELAADSELKKIRQSGMRVEKHAVKMHGNKYWRLSVAGFPSRQAAHAFIRNVAAKHGFPDAWVYQMSPR